MPMYDPTNTQIIGIIHISQDISIIAQTKNKHFFVSSIVLLVTITISVIIAAYLVVQSQNLFKLYLNICRY